MKRTSILALVALFAACGGEEEAATEAPATEAPATEGEGEAETEAEAPPADDGPCPAATSLTIANLNGSPHLDGVEATFEPTSGFADVTLDKTADFVFTTYEFPEDPQFGMAAPTGNPDVPDGELIFQISIEAAGDALAAGEFTEDGAAGGRVSTNSMYRGSSRIIPMVDHSLELTEITAEHLCGTITAAEGSFPGVSGRFKVDRE